MVVRVQVPPSPSKNITKNNHNMCICINCKYIKYCKTYSLIESKHKLTMSHDIYSFTPNHTIIQVNLKKQNEIYTLDWDLIECLSFTEQPGSWKLKNQIIN